MTEYYTWNTQSEAQSAMDFINNTPYFPLIGTNAKTGKVANDKQLTTAWATELLELTGGGFAFERISSDYLALYNIPQASIDYFFDTYNPIIKELNWNDFVYEDVGY